MTDTGKREDRRVRRTRRLLTQALTELMQRKQVNEITVKELTDAADMNRGTFYLYYKDIYDMIEKIEDDMFNKLNAIFTLRKTRMSRSRQSPSCWICFGLSGTTRTCAACCSVPTGI